MAGKVNQQVLTSEACSDHLMLLRECRSPYSMGGRQITTCEATRLEHSAMLTVAQAESARVGKRMSQQIDHRGPLGGFDERTERDINSLRQLWAEVASFEGAEKLIEPEGGQE